MAKDIELVKRIISALGFDLSNGKWGIKVYRHAIIITFLIINSVIFVVNKWEDAGKRLDGVKGLVLYIMCLSYFLNLTCNWDNSMLLIKIIEQGLHKPGFRSSTKDSELRERILIGMRHLNTIWIYGITTYTSLALLSPVTIFMFRLLQYDIEDITTELLYTAIPFYFPKSYDSILVYLLVYIMQSAFTLYGNLTGLIVVVTAFNSMLMVEGELKLLRLSLYEFDSMDKDNYRIGNEESNKYTTKHSDYISKSFLRYFIRHHYEIYRKINDVTKGIQLVAFSINSGMSILLCTSIYSVARRKAILGAIQESILGSFLAFCLYCYNLMGERISTENENLTRALYESAWIDKPQWFKKTIQIIMCRTSRPVEMKSVGLFVFNLRNFLLTMRAAYSYYNVLSQL